MSIDFFNSKLKKCACYTFLFVPLVFLVEILTFGISNCLNSINILIGIISIPCCILYYKISRKDSLFLYILIYISIIVEHITNILIIHKDKLELLSLITPFIFRGILLIFIYYDIPVKKKIVKYKKSSIVISLVLNICFILIDNFSDFEIKHTYIFIFTYLCYQIIAYYFVGKLALRAFKNKDFINTIYILNIVILGFRILIYIIGYVYSIHLDILILCDKFLFFTAFSIVLLGLFVELEYILFENRKLNNDVKIISNNIREIKELEKIRGQFFANISHELKTPLNIMFSCVQLLNTKKDSGAEILLNNYNKYESILRQNCYRMIRLINNLVDITKIDSGFMSLNFDNYNIVELVETITLSVVPYIKSKNINITFDTSIEDLIIRCDSDSIERIILNLLSNSIKFANDDGNILVSIDCDSDYVIIKVEDDGIGIPEDNKSSVFEIFVQGDKSLTRKKEGSGIGLSLVKSLVSLHNGLVYIDEISPHFNEAAHHQKSSNCGTTIIIKLPKVTLDNGAKTTVHDTPSENSIVSKINIEFSDIYDLY